jgi:hypothetical protein
MKRIVSLLAVVSVMSAFGCAGAEGWEPGTPRAPRTQQQGIELSSERTGEEPPSGEVCIGIPPTPPVPEEIDLDTWDFGSTPLLPTTAVTQSLYFVAFGSPVDPARIYVYGIDVAASRFIFAGSLSKRYVVDLSRRFGIDIGNFQVSGAANGKSGGMLEIEGPIPPPPPPNIHDWGIRNYGHYAWKKGVVIHSAAF